MVTPNTLSFSISEMELEDKIYDGDVVEGFCLKVDPIRCACSHLVEYLEAIPAHVILVWKEKDDDTLLSTAHQAQALGHDCRIVDYSKKLGQGVDFYKACELGLFAPDRLLGHG